MPRVTFEPTGNTINAPADADLLQAAREARVDIESPCGGEGTCGKCIVKVESGDVDSDCHGVLPQAAVAEGYALACKTRLLNTPVTIHVPEAADHEEGKFTAEDETYLLRQELLPQNWEYDPLAVKWLFNVPEPQPEDGLSDFDRLTRAIQAQWGKDEVLCSLSVLCAIADVLRADGGRVTVTLVRDKGKLHIIRVEPGDKTTRNYAISVDVGTTTVAVQLINLGTASILGTRSAYNGQVSCGEDVISRINYARRPGGLRELRDRVLETINDLTQQVCRAQCVSPSEISNAVVSANTTMTHLLLGMKPEYIRLAPYTPTVLEVPYLTAGTVGIDINPDSWVCFSPNNGSYVGGDITSGLLCTDLSTNTDEISLFIDIGTNGELVVGNGDFLMSCACSAGPAFEGSGIACGMRAATGAIEKADVVQETGAIRYETIGNAPPEGICGSGMIDLLANLFLTGWIDPAGKFDRTRNSDHIVFEGNRAAYILVRAEESATGRDLCISEMDIGNILRAKAAIYSACALMLDQLGLAFDDLAHIYVAGGFGRFLNLDKAIVLGLLPDVPRERFRFIGNASLMGGYMVVVSRENRLRQEDLARRMTYVDLSTDPAYMDQYTGALFLPHTRTELFPSVKEAMAGAAK